MSRQIVGISLVRNEDLYIRQAITNVSAFCDRIIILDNYSTDNTSREIEWLKAKYTHIESHRIKDYRESHSYISPFAGTDTWAFGVDGDEIYYPKGLEQLRAKLLSHEFDRYWALFGNVVNCVELDTTTNIARGYPSPPSRSMTKLFNFSALQSWNGQCERFHGGKKFFSADFSESLRLALHETLTWDESFFRCLHLCFIKRSSKEVKGALSRLQPGEKPRWLKNIDQLGLRWLVASFIQSARSPWKQSKYTRGDLVTVDTDAFFSQ